MFEERMMKQMLLILMVITALPACSLFMHPKKDEAKKHETSTALAVEKSTAVPAGLSVDMFGGVVSLQHFRFYNPPGFKDRVMLDIPELYASYDPKSLSTKSKHLYDARVDIAGIVIVRDRHGAFNFKSFTEAKPAKKVKKKTRGVPVAVDRLELKIGKIYYKDYTTPDKPVTIVFKVDMSKVYQGKKPDELPKAITADLIKNISIERLDNISVADLPKLAASAWAAVPDDTKEKLLGPAKDAAKTIGDLGKQLLQGAKDVEKAAADL
jgi:hypothetical protein